MEFFAEKNGIGLVVRLWDPKKRNEASIDWTRVLGDEGVVSIENPDFDVPRLDRETLSDTARRVSDAWRADQAVCVHCGAGIGRTGAFAILLLAELVRAAGSVPEKSIQRRFLKDFLDKMGFAEC